jgi:hypothetical protein
MGNLDFLLLREIFLLLELALQMALQQGQSVMPEKHFVFYKKSGSTKRSTFDRLFGILEKSIFDFLHYGTLYRLLSNQ